VLWQWAATATFAATVAVVVAGIAAEPFLDALGTASLLP
jgi:hypothetical protein